MRPQVDGDGSPTAVLLGLDGFHVLAAAEVAGEVELVETSAAVTGCPACGVIAMAKDRRAVTVRDLPLGGRPVVLVWHKRIWSCLEPLCARRSWTESSPVVRPVSGKDDSGFTTELLSSDGCPSTVLTDSCPDSCPPGPCRACGLARRLRHPCP
jgi:hypothetical protein